MGVFSRFKDIVSSNMNALLDRAEDPEKLIRLMVREMEETLVELKSSCAKSMADRKNLDREYAAVDADLHRWNDRAEMAVERGRDDLAREALQERNAFQHREETLKEEMDYLDTAIMQTREDITRLEEKLAGAREKQRLLVQRHVRASERTRTGRTLTKVDSSDVMLRFDKFENHIEQLEAEAELSAPSPQLRGAEGEFAQMEKEDSIEAELARMKAKRQQPADEENSGR
ncbi:phage shock protein PspA [Desulfobaculum bizertense]|uniref:Phage shock protein A (PspA) family protein n=1 Tax=Desulfobaculum bizertense DSM 18034 TaxID=1121442 RepID=A0A1T4VFL4_9BACT|nr:phage shock protein PspA [Desulfobaculum bizertense]UIJ37738.1 phage shock protein PspA [Desulfobaculum bizertense]SKA63752.1 phage shock protein A (PspA) family protein [Desulfobaculum bizertense DSM 18034]